MTSFRVTDHRGTFAIELDHDQTRMPLPRLVIARLEPVNDCMRREPPIFLDAAPFHDIVGLVRESSASGSHRGVTEVDCLLPEVDIDPASFVAADMFKSVTAEAAE